MTTILLLVLSTNPDTLTRDVIIPDWLPQKEAIPAVNFAVNTATNTTSTLTNPLILGNGRLRYDLRLLSHEPTRLAHVWDNLDYPYSTDGYRADWLITQLLDAHYYDFRGYNGKTLNQVAAEVGVDFKKSINLNADQRVAIAVSGVSESVRRIDRYQGIGGRHNTGVFFATWDTKKNKSALDKNPLYNLIKFFPDGGEAIFELPNGLHGFVIYDARRNLVRAGDTELVNDYTVPGAHDKAVRPAIGCIRCHGPHQGLWPAPNHIKQLFDANEIDIAGDLNDPSSKANERLAGQYLGDFTRRLRLAREDYQRAVRRITVTPDYPQGLTVEEVSAAVSSIYNDYRYQPVTPQQAMLESGGILPQQGPIKNVTLSLLRINVPVRRESWEEYHKQIKGANHAVITTDSINLNTR